MKSRFFIFILLILASLMITSCATTSTVKEPDPNRIVAAKRFLHAFDAKKLVTIGLERALEKEVSKYPEGAKELTRRVMSNIKAEDFIDMMAEIYARNLTRGSLTELAKFVESPTGNRFFNLIIDSALEGKQANVQNEVMSKFNADELTEIMRFSMSPAFKKMNRVQYKINRELMEAGRQLGQEKIQEYLEQN